MLNEGFAWCCMAIGALTFGYGLFHPDYAQFSLAAAAWMIASGVFDIGSKHGTD